MQYLHGRSFRTCRLQLWYLRQKAISSSHLLFYSLNSWVACLMELARGSQSFSLRALAQKFRRAGNFRCECTLSVRYYYHREALRATPFVFAMSRDGSKNRYGVPHVWPETTPCLGCHIVYQHLTLRVRGRCSLLAHVDGMLPPVQPCGGT